MTERAVVYATKWTCRAIGVVTALWVFNYYACTYSCHTSLAYRIVSRILG